MGKQWSYFVFLAWLTYLMISGVILFTRGFLLNRESRVEVGECSTKLKPCASERDEICTEYLSYDKLYDDQESAAKTCLGRQAKVVLLIIDALRYDFLTWDENLTSDNALFYQNKLPVINEVLKNHPDDTRLYKFLADPPTVTIQRLKGLTTGSLPTFIDAGSNFGTEEIGEDNIIDQASSSGIIFMGDDTWMGLYPNRFLRQYPFPSFNIRDLDTVDNGIKDQIFNELKKTDWSLLVAHTLGVDHCGHKYGPNHPEMERKLKEMNLLIGRLINEIKNDTMLIVVGDHGMTATGDHGGETKWEVEAPMFVYSKVPMLDKKYGENIDEVQQIDLVPTLAAILGIPIPFSNLGTTIIDVLPRNNNERGDKKLKDYQYALHSIWSNVVQTKNYIDAYSSDSSLFPKEKLKTINDKYDDIYRQVKRVDSFKEFEYFARDAREFLKMIRDMCFEVWVQFDSNLMSRGLVLTFSTIFFSYIIVDGLPRDRIPDIFESSFLHVSIVANLVTGFCVLIIFSLDFIQDLQNIILFATGMVSVFMLALLVVQKWEIISSNWYKNHKTRKLLNYGSRLIFLLAVCGLFSNSYIIEESLVLSFLLITLIWLIITNVKNTENVEHADKRSKYGIKSRYSLLWIFLISPGLISTLLIRFSSYYWTCRDEQTRSCDILELRKAGGIISESSRRVIVIVTLIIIALFVTLTKIWLRSCGNLAGYSPNVTAVRYLPVIVVVCMGGYWVLQHLPKDAKVKFIRPWQVDMLTWVVYFCIALGITLISLRPLCVYLLPRKKESLNVYAGENIIPQLFNGIKGLIYKKNENKAESLPVVYGLGTAYSATFVSLSVFFTLLCALLLGDTLAPSIVVMYVICVCVLGITATERFQHAANINELFDVPTPSLICWFLVAEYFFYATGHQPAFPKIQWDAAFVGTGGNFPTNVIPAILIGINTFGSYILTGITLPVVVIAPFTLYFMFPSLAGNKFQQGQDLKRGELILYERENSFLSATFSVSAKYILFHGIRTFGCMLAATIHCRHLMVWNIFSPKLIFEGISFMVTIGSVMVSYLLLIRLHHQVDKLLSKNSKIR